MFKFEMKYDIEARVYVVKSFYKLWSCYRWCIKRGSYFKFLLTIRITENDSNSDRWTALWHLLVMLIFLFFCGMSEVRIFWSYYFEKFENQHNSRESLLTFYDKHRRVKDYTNYYFQQKWRYTHNANMFCSGYNLQF